MFLWVSLHILTLFCQTSITVWLVLFSLIVGMMISAFAKAGQVLGDESYVQRALEAIQFVQRDLFQAHTHSSATAVSGNRLLRSCYVNVSTEDIAHRSIPVSFTLYL